MHRIGAPLSEGAESHNNKKFKKVEINEKENHAAKYCRSTYSYYTECFNNLRTGDSVVICRNIKIFFEETSTSTLQKLFTTA